MVSTSIGSIAVEIYEKHGFEGFFSLTGQLQRPSMASLIEREPGGQKYRSTLHSHSKERLLIMQSAPARDEAFDDKIVGKIVKMGCACATDLATQLGSGAKAKDLIEPLEDLVRRRVLRHKVDKNDPRAYVAPEQTVYELAR
jgi:hypothetical protein